MSKEHHGPSAYDDPGTPEEISRRQFMANATLTLSGIIGVTLAIPIVGSLLPQAGAGAGTWSPLDANEWKQLQSSTDKPVKIEFTLTYKDAYLPKGQTAESVWGIKVKDLEAFKKARPDIYLPNGTVKAFGPDIVTMGFVVFSPICPHLGCRFNYDDSAGKFMCPCHGSQFDGQGAHLAGPAPRGLDPLPLREQNGQAEVTWIRYQSTTPDRIVISYTS